MLKYGTRIETFGTPSIGGFPMVRPETGRVVRPRAGNLPLPGADWHIVRFDSDGGKLCVHTSRFRVTDNREAHR